MGSETAKTVIGSWRREYLAGWTAGAQEVLGLLAQGFAKAEPPQGPCWTAYALGYKAAWLAAIGETK